MIPNPIDGLDVETLKKEIRQEFLKQKILESLGEDEIDFSELIAMVKRNLLWLLVIPLLVAGITWATLETKEYYVSKATVFQHSGVQAAATSSLGSLLAGFGLAGAAESGGGGYLNTLLKSERLKKEVFKKVPAASAGGYSKEWRQIIADGSGLMIFSIETTDATLSLDLVNGYISCLEGQLLSPARRKRMYVEKQLEKTKVDYDKAVAAFRAFQEKYLCLSFDAKITPLFSRYYSYKEMIIGIEMELKVAEKSLKLQGNVPDLMRISSEKMLNQVKRDVYLETVTGLEGSLKETLAISYEFKQLDRELKFKENMYNTFLQQLEVAKIADIQEESMFEIIDGAEPGLKVTYRETKKIWVNALIAAFFVLFFIIFREYMRRPEYKETPA